MKELVAVGEKLGVTVDDKTAGALAVSLQAMRDACKDEATSQVRGGACLCVCVCVCCLWVDGAESTAAQPACQGPCMKARTQIYLLPDLTSPFVHHTHTPKHNHQQALMLLATKPMQLAEYFCTATASDPLNWRHYALAMGHYTHFTSPIRYLGG